MNVESNVRLYNRIVYFLFTILTIIFVYDIYIFFKLLKFNCIFINNSYLIRSIEKTHKGMKFTHSTLVYWERILKYSF